MTLKSRLSPLLPLLILLLPHGATSLHVSPNSPCTSFCLDSADSNSTTTTGDDIVCLDDSFNSKAQGQKFQRCLACLADSDYVSGDENDQDWYLYNLRYAFDYCIFGYPNASHIASDPCVTSEACGRLQDALKVSLTTPNDRTQYDYCEADDKAMLTDAYSTCYSCVRADGTHAYLSNFLVALEAGCQQQPSPGTPVSLNDTVFTAAAIQPSNPTSAPSSSTALASASIAGIVIGILVALLILVGCVFIQYRKRRNRARARVRERLGRSQPFSFYQQERARESEFSDISRGDYYHDSVPMDEQHQPQQPQQQAPAKPRPANISTSIPWPSPVHPSPREASFRETYATPPSTSTSTRSNLISPLFSPGFGVASPRNMSPRFTRSSQPMGNEYEGGGGQHSRGLSKELRKKQSWGAVAPTEIRTIQIKFDPPPKRPKK
ncbi:hypothetical protein B0T10DRAFT_284344 [Thelonectria olida]|uniref:LPXTG-domain-containing protein n=1 Tax=Thelonectria olida TaxID=1576542 RepID=A0A9P9ARW3_9HYPO|nr:hypothetical protein B0T10DRAFT_284344 [Thelonectria olida]